MRLNLAIVLAHRYNQIPFIFLWTGLAVSKPDMIAHLEDGQGPWVVVREISRTPNPGELIRTSRMKFIPWMKQNIWNILRDIFFSKLSQRKSFSLSLLFLYLPLSFPVPPSLFFPPSLHSLSHLSLFYFWFLSHPALLS